MAQNHDPAEVSEGLRLNVLTLDPKDIGLTRESYPHSVFGIVTDMGFAEGTATLLTIADGTTSLYFSGGGGIIGAGEHETVRKASHDLLAKAQPLYKQARATKSFPYPQPGHVVFYFLTFDGVRSYSDTEENLAGGDGEMSAFFFAVHEVLAEVRQAEPR